MTSSHHQAPPRGKRPTAPANGRGRGRAIELGGGLQMSCQELDEDHVVIRFAWPSSPRRRPRGLSRHT